MTAARQSTGQAGEDAVCALLERSRCRTLERNARTRLGEIDLIYLERGTLVFAEIKALRGRDPGAAARALESIGPRKQLQVRRLARAWLGEHPAPAPYREIRFDAFGVCVGPRGRAIAIEHLRAAF